MVIVLTANTSATGSKNYWKYISIIILTSTHVLSVISMSYSRIRLENLYITSTAVVMTELIKLIISLILVYPESLSLNNIFEDSIKISIPALVYIFQNNLLYIGISNLDAATFQITNQLKILTTAMFAVIILKRRLSKIEWISLIILFFGVVIVQLDKTDQNTLNSIKQNKLIGFICCLIASFLSGFAGIYFEKILKGSDKSIWIRNIQLSLISLPLGLIVSLVIDWKNIQLNGFFYGYDIYVIYLIFLQACGGLIVAMVVKYTDNIFKTFTTSFSIVISSIVSIYLFNFKLTLQFCIGALFIIISSITMYINPFNDNKTMNYVRV